MSEPSTAIVPEFALTLTQPWATLVAIGAKRIETRGWSTHRRGRIAIHAAKGFPADARSICYDEPFRSTLLAAGYENAAQLPTAAIIATTELRQCYGFNAGTLEDIRRLSAQGGLPPHEATFGDFSPGRYGLMLRHTTRLTVVVPAKGALSFWRIPSEARRLLATALERHAA